MPLGTGTDWSTNKPSLPNVGANFPSTGAFANWVLIGTIPQNLTRNRIELQNYSGVSIAIIRDDGIAAAGTPPTNATIFVLASGISALLQGNTWSSTTFKGRVQIYALSASAIVAAMED